ncbi:unnamed protein product [Blepharisma stoltei]|uniref:Uncharacterized protein n=1 Tax=Blepharisma stoltei TaxID=1481888 RepID=A0AAU9JEW8_9CILI|nr:unnamed protein product [Blepharisma stoltei]
MFFLTIILLKCDIEANNYKENSNLDINSKIFLLSKENFSKPVKIEEDYLRRYVNEDLLTSLVKGFLLEEEKERSYETKVLHSSAIWLSDEKLFLVALSIRTPNLLNYIYITFFDSEWNEIKKESFIGATKIPDALKIPTLKWKSLESGTVFKALESEYFISFSIKNDDFNVWDHFIYSFTTGKIRELYHNRKENNLSPLIIDDYHIYFLASYNNLNIIDCTSEENICNSYIDYYQTSKSSISSGTAFLRYKNSNYFFSLSLSRVDYGKDKSCDIVMPSLSVLQILTENPFFKLIYSSEPIMIWNTLLLNPNADKSSKFDNILLCGSKIIPNSVTKWDEDEDDIMEIIINSDKDSPVVVKVEGFNDFLQSVISQYESKRALKETELEEMPTLSNENKEKENEAINSENNKSCPDEKYYDEDTKACKSCFKGCLKCNSLSNCLQCKDLYAVVDNGRCKCVEGYLSQYNPDTHEFSCKWYDKPLGSESDYRDLLDIEFGYKISQDSLSMILANKDIEKGFIENNFCDFDISKEKSQKIKSTIVKNGISVEIEIKVTKI